MTIPTERNGIPCAAELRRATEAASNDAAPSVLLALAKQKLSRR